MNVTLKADAQRFVEEQARSGRYRTRDEVLEAAVQHMIAQSKDKLDDATVKAINRAEEQLDRGEGIDFDKFAAAMRRRIASHDPHA
jgi:Arc/MetJ-type ribon-helix-helix transcriptional regulator